MDDLTMGERLDDALHKQGISQKMLAEKTGLSPSLISDLVNGKDRKINHEAIIKICKTIGISADYLLGLSKIKSLDPNIKSVCEFTGLSQAAVEKILDIKPATENSVTETLGFLNAVNFMLERKIDLLWDIYNYLFTDFGVVYIDKKNNSIESFIIEPTSKMEKPDTFDSSNIRFMANKASKNNMMYSYGLTSSEYAGILLQRITQKIQRLRDKTQEKVNPDV